MADLRARLGLKGVLSNPSDLVVYECDGFTVEKHPPEAVVFPTSAADVAEVVKIRAGTGARGGPRGRHQSGRRMPAAGGGVVVSPRG